MLSQTSSAKMELVDLALNDWSFAAAEVATAANPLVGGSGLFPRFPGSDSGLQRSSFGIDASGHDQSTQRELAGSNLQHIRIGMATEGAGQKAEPNEHHEGTGGDDPSGCLRRHEA